MSLDNLIQYIATERNGIIFSRKQALIMSIAQFLEDKIYLPEHIRDTAESLHRYLNEMPSDGPDQLIGTIAENINTYLPEDEEWLQFMNCSNVTACYFDYAYKHHAYFQTTFQFQDTSVLSLPVQISRCFLRGSSLIIPDKEFPMVSNESTMPLMKQKSHMPFLIVLTELVRRKDGFN